MSLKPNEYLLIITDYILTLAKRKKITLWEIPDSYGVMVVTSCPGKISSIAPTKKGEHHPDKQKNKRLGVGTILTPAWYIIKEPSTKIFFDVLASKTGIPNHWIELPNHWLLEIYLRVKDLPTFIKIQNHIIDENDSSDMEKQYQLAALSVALFEAKRLLSQIDANPTPNDKRLLAHTVVYIKKLFEKCYLAVLKNNLASVPRLAQQIVSLSNHPQVKNDLADMIRQLDQNQHIASSIFPIDQARQRAGERLLQSYRNELLHTLHMLERYLKLINDPVKTTQNLPPLSNRSRKTS